MANLRDEYRAIVRIQPGRFPQRDDGQARTGPASPTPQMAVDAFLQTDGSMRAYVETRWDRRGVPRSGRWAEVEVERIEHRQISEWAPAPVSVWGAVTSSSDPDHESEKSDGNDR
jgi:hypothetical protein